MAVYQLVPTLLYGDAIGNETIIIKKFLNDNGYTTEIFALGAGEKVQNECKLASELLSLDIKDNDILIYHFAVGSNQCIEILKKINCKKIMLYHNITPSYFFSEYSEVAMQMCDEGRRELIDAKEIFDYCLAHSEYSKNELVSLGYKCSIDVLPLLIPFEDYEHIASSKILKQYSDDGYVNLLFVGRITPNKKQEDIIKVFNYYKKHINFKSRLIFVGNPDGMELYYNRLKNYVKALELEDVIFTGHIGFDEILAYYRIADVFLCMSEHEGFGVPLVEAMYFKVPIIAYESSAIPWVLGGSGILVNNKNSVLWANLIEMVLQDKELKEDIVRGQCKRIVDFSFENTSSLFLKYLSDFSKNINNYDSRDNGIISKIKLEIKEKGLVDNSIEFNEIELEIKDKRNIDDLIEFKNTSTSTKKEYNSFKKMIKYMTFKPAFKHIYKFNPELANGIRNKIYELIRR